MAERTPRISINKLAEYMTASPTRQRRIVLQQKRPATFMLNWYDAAQQTITRFLTADEWDEEVIVSEIDRLYALPPANDYEETRNRTNAEALESFLSAYDCLALDDVEVSAGSNDARKLEIEGVEVSVRPEFMLVGRQRGSTVHGAIKLYLNKNLALTDQTAGYIGAALHRFTERATEATPTRRYCQVFDVFAGEVYPAPTATKTRFRDVQAACEQIRLLWEVV